jgi:GR25 family glycosyltransferase involved in LPS biosynthesis
MLAAEVLATAAAGLWLGCLRTQLQGIYLMWEDPRRLSGNLIPPVSAILAWRSWRDEMSLNVIYINLDSATQRRAAVEASFASHAPHWRLHRFPASRGEDAVGTIRAAERGCFLSHRAALRESLTMPGHILICEDDVILGKETALHIEEFLMEAQDARWDLLYTDVAIPEIETMARLVSLKRQLRACGRRVTGVDLQSLTYAGATSYLVNERSKDKLYRLVEAEHVLDRPYDIALRSWVHNKTLRAFATFPFITTLSGAPSQIQPEGWDFLWDTFRRLIWLEAGDERELVEQMRSGLDEELSIFGMLFAYRASEVYRNK